VTLAVGLVSRHFRKFALVAYLIVAFERVYITVLDPRLLYTGRDWQPTQYFVNYIDHGFAKRALIGTLLRPLAVWSGDPKLVMLGVMVAISAIGVALVVWLVDRTLPHRADAPAGMGAMLRCAIAIGSPGVLQIAHEYGRYDILGFLLLAAALALVARGRAWAAMLACVAAILIHEAFAVYGLPLVMAALWMRQRHLRAPVPLAPLAPMAAVVGGTCLLVLLFGNSEGAAALEVGAGAGVWQRGLIEYQAGLDPLRAAVTAAYWLALFAVLARFYQGNGLRPDALGLAALAPVLLNGFGIDHARWVGVGFAVLVANLGYQVAVLGRPMPAPGWATVPALVLCLPLGPLGVINILTWVLG
jgi:hypothetical protein